VYSLRQHNIVLTTPGTVYSQLLAYSKARDAVSTGSSVKVPKNGWPLIGVPRPRIGTNGKIRDVGRPQRWLCIILDEAHTIRNREASISKARPRIQAEHRVAVNGTPIQNSPEDIFSLLRFIGGGLGADLVELWIKIKRKNSKRRTSERQELAALLLNLHAEFACRVRDGSIALDGRLFVGIMERIALKYSAGYPLLQSGFMYDRNTKLTFCEKLNGFL